MSITNYFEFVSNPKIIYGPGSLKQVGRVSANLGCKKPFLVIDRVFVDSGIDKKIGDSLAKEGLALAGMLTDIPPDSDIETVKKGYETAAAAGADLVIGVGGGSTLDTAKGLRIMMGEGGNLPEGMNVIKSKLPPMLAIPTTAGTGSESTSAAVIRNIERDIKIIYVDAKLMPDVALLDPELTLTLPASFTAGTGMDALAHSVESLHSTCTQLISQGMALHAIKLIFRSLPVAVKEPDNMKARGEMLLAATIAGLAFSNSLVGIVHAAAHAAGAAFRVPHGTACGLFLAYGMEFNLGTPAEEAYAEAAHFMGVNTSGMDTRAAAMAAIRAVRDLALEVGIPKSLADAGVPEDGLAKVAEKAMMDGTMMTNPRQPSDAQLKAFLKKAWLGLEPCEDAIGGSAPEAADKADKKEAPAAPKEEKAAANDAAKEEKKASGERRAFTRDDMYKTAGKFIDKMFNNPTFQESLKGAALRIRFVYFNEDWGDEEAMITVDCAQNPVKVDMGETDIDPMVTMRMSSETARLFWLQKVNLMGAISKGDITIQGQVNEAMRLLPAIKPGFEIFKNLK